MDLGDKGRRSQLTSIALLLILVGALFGYSLMKASVLLGGVRYFSLGDDAMISMRYAYNLAHGQGLVWNPGERVEGFTNLGWTLVMAAIHLLRLPLALNSLAVLAVNLALHLSLVVFIFRGVRRRQGAVAAWVASVLVGFNLPLLWWSLEGFETSLQSLLLTAAFLPLLPLGGGEHLDVAHVRFSPLMAGLATVVRPDAAVPFLVVSLVSLGLAVGARPLEPATNSSQGNTLTVVVSCVVLGGLLILGVLWFQYSYYGDWLPNTFRLKTSGGARHFVHAAACWWRFLVDDLQLMPVVFGVSYVLRGWSRGARWRYSSVTAILLAWFAYVTWTGGDVFAHSRFFTPVLPLLITAAGALAHELVAPLLAVQATSSDEAVISLRLRRGMWRLRLLAFFALTSMIQGAVCVMAVRHGAAEARAIHRDNILVAEGIKRLQPPVQGTIGVFWAGTSPYFMPEHRFHDFLGKSDAHIARLSAKKGAVGHNKWDYDYSLGRIAPALLVTSAAVIPDSMAHDSLEGGKDFFFFPALLLHPLFRQCYALNPIVVRVGDEQPKQRGIYARVAHDSSRLCRPGCGPEGRGM